MAPSSQRTCRSQWSRFESFCANYRLGCRPATVDTICLYVTFLAFELEYTTVLNYVALLPSYHPFHNFDYPDLSHFKIKEALAGVQRRRHELPNRREVILPHHLMAIRKNLRFVEPCLRATFWAACLTAFFSLIKSANLFWKTDNLAYLHVLDVLVISGAVSLSVQTLKTNRFKEKRNNIPLAVLGTHHVVCPTAAVQTMLRETGAINSDALFSFRDRSRLLPLSSGRFNDLLRKTLRKSGFLAKKISTHSFRRGATTFASENGISVDAIKAQGHWRSTCYARYISRDEQLREQFSTAMAAALPVLP